MKEKKVEYGERSRKKYEMILGLQDDIYQIKIFHLIYQEMTYLAFYVLNTGYTSDLNQSGKYKVHQLKLRVDKFTRNKMHIFYLWE